MAHDTSNIVNIFLPPLLFVMLIINDCDLKVNTFYEKIFKKSYPQLYSQPVDNFRLHKWPVLSFLV